MKNIISKVFLFLFGLLLGLVILFYLSFLFIMPSIINNNPKIVSDIIKNKTGYIAKFENLKVKTRFNLKGTIETDSLSLLKEKEFLKLKKLHLDFFIFKIKNVEIDYLFFDYTKFKKDNKGGKNKLSNLPNIKIKKADVILKDYLKLYFEKVSLKDKNLDLITNLKGVPIFVKGKIGNKLKINVISNGLNSNDVKELFLFVMRNVKPKEKNFLENFDKFYGKADINLTFENYLNNKKLNGCVTLNNFQTKFIKVPVPMQFDEATFYFKDKNIELKKWGKFGGYPLYFELLTNNLFEKNLQTKGFLESRVGGDVFKKYIKDAYVNGFVNLKVEFNVVNKIPKVNYTANIFKGTIVNYKNSTLGLNNHKRKILAHTTKIQNNMHLNSFSYSYLKNDNDKNYTVIMQAKGLFKKRFPRDKFKLSYIEAKTNDYAPISVIGVISKYLYGGSFKGNFKYEKDKLTGKLYLINTKYKDFIIKNAYANLNDVNGTIEASGFYLNSPFKAYLDIDNNLDDIEINKIDLYLKKYEIKRQKGNKKSIQSKRKIPQKVKDININEAKLRLDELKFENIILNNLYLKGNIQNSIANFDMPNISFAKGFLGAKGIYNIKTNSSNIDFSAKDINSNVASSMVFNLKDQFEGIANAKMNVKTYNKLQKIDAKASFSINDGALTKLGSSDFVIENYRKGKNPIRFKIQDIINVDIKKMQALKSDIEGHFDVHNEKVQNVEIFNKNKSLSLYLKGDYNIKTSNTNACLFARYNRASQKGIKIFFIPLSWITKIVFKNENTKLYYQSCIDKIPPIEAKKGQEEIVLVKLIGNLNNTKSLKVDLKSIR